MSHSRLKSYRAVIREDHIKCMTDLPHRVPFSAKVM